ISPSDGSLSNVWTKSSTYGWKASAYISGAKQASEATVTTPEIDLSEYKDITLTFEHAVKFAASPSSVLSVEVECEGKVTTLSVPTWPAGDSWTFYDSGEVSLDDYAGKTIKLIFRYTSSTSEASTWEVREIKVQGEKVTSSLSDVEIAPSAPDFTLPYEVYSLDGKRIADIHIIRGIVIVRQNGHSWLISRQ
ncbi:MAG: choice-of-anchor J domain-containing protein, partial [Bacteroidales bacterium]|nr:choice-of-anchor J domain-containing protein [Bacteroidales bacterium]